MKDIKSSLRFLNYVVDSVEFKNNPNFEGEEIQLRFEPSVEFDIEGDELLVFLSVSVFKDAEKYNSPFEMNVRVVGYFKLYGDGNIEKYKINAVSVLFPYVRSIITTYTAAANVNPLILPTVNINKMLAEKDMQENEHKK